MGLESVMLDLLQLTSMGYVGNDLNVDAKLFIAKALKSLRDQEPLFVK